MIIPGKSVLMSTHKQLHAGWIFFVLSYLCLSAVYL